MTTQPMLGYNRCLYIIISIVSFAERVSLRAFRRTRRQHSDHITAQLDHHIVFQGDGSITSKDGVLVFSPPLPMFLGSPNLSKIPAISPHLQKLFQQAKIVDVHYSGWFYVRPVHLTSVEVVRVYLDTGEASIPPSRTVICRVPAGRLLQGIERLIFFSDCIHAVGDWRAPFKLRVQELVVIFRENDPPWKVANKLAFALGSFVSPEVDYGGITIVNAPDADSFLSDVRKFVRELAGERVNVDDIQWRFITLKEFLRPLSPVEREAILLG